MKLQNLIISSVILFLIFFTDQLNAQIKIWPNNHVIIGWGDKAPDDQLNVSGNSYFIPNGAQSGFYFENFHNNN